MSLYILADGQPEPQRGATSFKDCYSPTCTRYARYTCYSPGCPWRLQAPHELEAKSEAKETEKTRMSKSVVRVHIPPPVGTARMSARVLERPKPKKLSILSRLWSFITLNCTSADGLDSYHQYPDLASRPTPTLKNVCSG
ncbi:hypothetical protein BOTBODRAFT_35711 [Botryobasidium botryosum FD-172 SS1]|uniref:Uncharacterized protein n=1 Tax=Botryobasidium botryosum (strain FD-172 SS1) TaxID=930990 RepID=A0A067M6H1_BOTB1|nr:hypothetical protein BOTBODRAFT_35711 [Botryobasidium botryosum FD-172 SS1]